MKYYNKTTYEVIEINPELYSQWVASGNPKAQMFELVPDPPTYDPATQNAPVFENGLWVVRDKTAEELQLEADRTQDALTLNQIINFVQQIKNGDGTAAERLQRLETAVAFLIKKTFIQNSQE